MFIKGLYFTFAEKFYEILDDRLTQQQQQGGDGEKIYTKPLKCPPPRAKSTTARLPYNLL